MSAIKGSIVNTFSLPSRKIRMLGQVPLVLLLMLKVSFSVRSESALSKRTVLRLLSSLLKQLGLGKDCGCAYKRCVYGTSGTRTGQLGLGKE